MPPTTAAQQCTLCGGYDKEYVPATKANISFSKKHSISQENVKKFGQAFAVQDLLPGEICDYCFMLHFMQQKSNKVIAYSKIRTPPRAAPSNNNKIKSPPKGTLAQAKKRRRISLKEEVATGEDESNAIVVGDYAKVQHQGLQLEQETSLESIQQYMHAGKSNFEYVKRIPYDQVTDEIIDMYLFQLGIPLVITGMMDMLFEKVDWKFVNKIQEQSHDTDVCKGGVSMMSSKKRQIKSISQLPTSMQKQQQQAPFVPQNYKEMFSLDYLKRVCGQIPITPRDNDDCTDVQGFTFSSYVDYLKLPKFARKPSRLYGKDLPMPSRWFELLFDEARSSLPKRFIYKGSRDMFADLPKELQPITLMIYVGGDGTHTPGHRDLCGALGHNLMVQSDPNAYALWCLMSSKDLPIVTQYFKDNGLPLDNDSCFLPLRFVTCSH